jgi:molecular chaperone GrpE (heat shock protein)
MVFPKSISFRVVVATALVGLFALSAPTLARNKEEKEALRKEIAELKTKIQSVKSDIEYVNGKIVEDKKAFVRYGKHASKNQKGLLAERDSLKKDYRSLSQQTEALARRAQQVKHQQREYDLMHEALSKTLMAACDEILATLEQFPPTHVEKPRDAVAFLRSEINAKSVDNMEAMERLWQVLGSLDDAGLRVDVFSGPSPDPAFSGNVDFIRLGHAYLACINGDGDWGAVWVPGADSAGTWQPVREETDLMALKKTAKIRQGKAVPSIARLPFSHPVVADSTEEGGL